MNDVVKYNACNQRQTAERFSRLTELQHGKAEATTPQTTAALELDEGKETTINLQSR